MFCPECKAEYRQGFSRCTDCDLALVEELPRETRPDTDETCVVWRGNAEDDCVNACLDLKGADIPYKVAQTPLSRDLRRGTNWHYEISVALSQAENAQQLLGVQGELADGDRGRDSENQREDDDSGVELPAEDDAPAIEPVGGDSYLNEWFPEDATAEVSSQGSADTASFIELSLKENRIRFRSDLLDNGTHKIFVLPDDEPRAREIIREILDGTPP